MDFTIGLEPFNTTCNKIGITFEDLKDFNFWNIKDIKEHKVNTITVTGVPEGKKDDVTRLIFCMIDAYEKYQEANNLKNELRLKQNIR